MRGGDTVPARMLWITDKAERQLAEIRPDLTPEELLAPLVGKPFRLFADGSDYWIHETQGLRLVFTVEKGRKPESGRFYLSTVQLSWGRKGK